MKHGLAEKINSQSQTKPKAANEQKAIFDDDVQIIVKDGKYYYLHDSLKNSE